MIRRIGRWGFIPTVVCSRRAFSGSDFDASVDTEKLYENQVCASLAERLRRKCISVQEYGKGNSKDLVAFLQGSRSSSCVTRMRSAAKQLKDSRDTRTKKVFGDAIEKWAGPKFTPKDVKGNFFNPDVCVFSKLKNDTEFSDGIDGFLRYQSTAVVQLHRAGGSKNFKMMSTEDEEKFQQWKEGTDDAKLHHGTIKVDCTACAIEITESGETKWEEKLWQLVKSWALFEAKGDPDQRPLYVLAFNSHKADFSEAIQCIQNTDLSTVPFDRVTCYFAPFRNMYSAITDLKDDFDKKFKNVDEQLKKVDDQFKKVDEQLKMIIELLKKKEK